MRDTHRLDETPVRAGRLSCCVALLAVLGVLFITTPITLATPAPAAAAPSTSVTAGSGTTASSSLARIDVESVTPSMVTSTSGPTVSVTGSVRNVTDQALTNLTMRLERGARVTDAAGLRSGLTEDSPVVAGGDFTTVSRILDGNGRQGFTLRMNLSGPGGLGIDETGVYPLNVVVDGLTPSGVSVRLAQSRTLLPVLSLPPDATRAQQYVNPSSGGSGTDIALGPDGSVSANTASPARLTMLWPLAAPPQLAPGVLGGGTEPVRLISDDMARSLSSGGRLHTLLDALHRVVGPTDPNAPVPGGSDEPDGSATDSATSDTATSSPGSPNTAASTSPAAGAGQPSAGGAQSTPTTGTGTATPSKLQQAMCVAVDPDLLVTVRAMSRGYVVSDNPADPMSATVPGTGRQAALDWLTTLRQIASRMCVVALPFAQADLTALARVDNIGLTQAALRSPAGIVDAILGVSSVRGLTIPALGGIDSTGAGLLTASGLSRTVTAATTVAPDGDASDSGAYLVSGVHAQSFDMPISAALGAMGTSALTPTLTPPEQQVDVAAESSGSRREAGLAALAYPSINAPRPTSGDTQTSLPTVGRSSFLIPPTYWSATGDDAEALFSTATVLLGSGAAVPGPLSDLSDQLDQAQVPAQLVNPPGVGPIASVAPQVSPTAVASIRDATELSFRLQSSLVDAADVEATPERYVAPLREDLLRSVRSPDENSAAVQADLGARRGIAVRAVSTTLQRMQQSVTILDPGGRYTLASERSPLLLVVRNSLALPIRVRIDTSAPQDLQIGDVGAIEIPANGTRQLQLPTRAGSSEALTVTITLTTSTGLELGTPIRLSVHSNAYGKPLFWVTIAAGVVLVALTARRLWHRFRGQPDPADVDRPDPDEHDKLLAGSTYQHRRRTLHHDSEHHDSEQQNDEYAPEPDQPADRA